MAPTSTTIPGPASTDGARPRARDELAALPAERLEAEVLGLSARMAAGTYELLVLIGELDARGTWVTWGALSCAAWLADGCDIEISTARTQVRVAKAMRTHPALDAAMATGDVSYAKARVLVPHLSEHNVSALIGLAETNPAGRLGAAIAAWAQRNEDPDTIRARQHQARMMSWRTEADGMVTITARLTPETAGAVCAMIDTAVTRTAAPAGASLAQQRRVIDERQHECQHPGCHARVFLQHDHIKPYTAGGPTTIDNLQRLCGPHNRARTAP